MAKEKERSLSHFQVFENAHISFQGGENMQKGFRRRRSLTPAARHLRAVSFRHTPYKSHRLPGSFVQAVSPVEPDHHKPVEFESIETIKKPGRREERKARKKAQEEDLFRRLASEPPTSFIETLLNPALSMEKVSTTDDVTLSRGTILLIHVIKWLSFGLCLADNASHFINKQSFSIASLSFSDAAGLAFRIAAFGFCMDYICAVITGIFGHVFDRRFSITKFQAVKARYYLLQTTGFLLSALIGLASNAAGAVIYTTTVVFAIMMRFHTYQLTSRFSTTKQLCIITINTVITSVLAMVYGHYAFAGIERILLYILNI